MKPPSVRVVVDSISDIPDHLAQELGIAVVPAIISFGQQIYREGIDLSREEFYARMLTYPGVPTTGAAGPGAYAQAYLGLIAENRAAGVPLEGIISFHAPARLSGLYNSAFSASQMVEGTRIEVIDTGQVSMGIGWPAVLAAQAARAGENMDSIIRLAKDTIQRVRLVAGLESLEWAARSGRVHRLTAALGTLLNVKPILKVQDGDVLLAERVRTHSRQVERVLEMARAHAPFREVAVMHARAAELAEAMADRLVDLHPRERIIVSEIGCILGSYTGPGTYGIVLVKG